MNKRKANRIEDYDYSQNGAYFVTICSMNKEKTFGEFVGARLVAPEMKLSHLGNIIENNPLQWELDEYYS